MDKSSRSSRFINKNGVRYIRGFSVGLINNLISTVKRVVEEKARKESLNTIQAEDYYNLQKDIIRYYNNEILYTDMNSWIKFWINRLKRRDDVLVEDIENALNELGTELYDQWWYRYKGKFNGTHNDFGDRIRGGKRKSKTRKSKKSKKAKKTRRHR